MKEIPNQVLLVEDNVRLNEINLRALVLSGYEVLTALCLAEARELLLNNKPDVILLDVMLPDGDGIAFCEEIREKTDANILFLTSRTEYEDRLKGLEVGGDDYITKPYKLDEMLLRVKAAMRRRGMTPSPQTGITLGRLTLDTLTQIASLHGEDLLLSQKEFSLFIPKFEVAF